MAHFARDGIAPQRKVNDLFPVKIIIYVFNSVFLTKSNLFWTVDLRAHVAKDKNTFVEFQQTSHEAKWIYVGKKKRKEKALMHHFFQFTDSFYLEPLVSTILRYTLIVNI